MRNFLDWMNGLENDGYGFVPDLHTPTYASGGSLSTLDYVGLSENLILVDWKIRGQFSAQYLSVLVSFLYKGPVNLQGLTLRSPPLRFPETARRMIMKELRDVSLVPETFKGSVNAIYATIELQ